MTGEYRYSIVLWVWLETTSKRGWLDAWNQDLLPVGEDLSFPSPSSLWGSEYASIKEWGRTLLATFKQFRGFAIQAYKLIDDKWCLVVEEVEWR